MQFLMLLLPPEGRLAYTVLLQTAEPVTAVEAGVGQ